MVKLDIVVRQEHTEIATAVAWSSDCQLLSASDDKGLCRWTSDAEKIGSIKAEIFVTCAGWFPSTSKQISETFAVSCTDGTFRFISRSGREEKKISAHEGAVLQLKWSHDGTALLTTGEDGDVKIWSKTGNLRSTLVSLGQAVYSASWGPDDEQVLISAGKSLMIKTTQSNTKKNLQWNAHDGHILCTDWNMSNGLIISGGEDCVYKLWDAFGRQMYSSKPLDSVVTSLAWAPNGTLFAVGSFNLVRVCDKVGWTHSRDRVSVGSVLSLAWTPDSTQFAGACGNGSLLFAQVTDRQTEWRNAVATLVSQRRLRVQDVAAETDEEIELAKDRVVEVSVGHEHLVVMTTTQCYIYTLSNLNTPIIFDTKAPPIFLQLCRRHFLTADLVGGVQVISFEGRVLSTPRHANFRADFLTKDITSLSPDTVALCDTADRRQILLFDTVSGKQTSKILHSAEVTAIALNQGNYGPQERLLAFLDNSHDLFLVVPFTSGSTSSSNNVPTLLKLQAHVDSFAFHDETNALATVSEGVLKLWQHPEAVFVDRDLMQYLTMDEQDCGRSTQLVSYSGNKVSLRKVDGAMMYTPSPVEASFLDELVRGNKWEEATRLCRVQGALMPSLWASLAALAMQKKQLDVAEVAYAELLEAAKVEFLQFVRGLTSEESRQAHLALFRRAPDEAERILLQAQPPQILSAIKLNIDLFRWHRALDLAQRYKTNVDTVLANRAQYLADFGQNETDNKFVSLMADFDHNTVDEILERDRQDLGEVDGRGGRGSNDNRRGRK